MLCKKKCSWFNPKTWFKSKNSKKTGVHNPPPVSMNIQTFMQASIVGIVSGIRGAQEEYLNENSAFAPLICPAWLPEGSSRGHSDKIHELEFDLAVTLTETSSSKVEGKAGITIVGVYEAGGGVSAASDESHAAVNRIRFKIPIRYPLMEVEKPDYNSQ